MNQSTLSRAHALSAPRLFPYFEAVAMVAVLWAFDASAVTESAGYQGWIVDPYLLPVLLIAARYGLVPGLFTAFAAAGARLAATMSEVAGWSSLRFLPPAALLPDLALLAVALIAGGLSDRVRSVIRELLIGVEALQGRFDRLSTQYTLLQDEKHVLDSHVLSEEETFEGVSALFDKLDRSRRPDLARDVLDLSVHLMGGGEAALYEVREDWGGPELKATTAVHVHDSQAGILVSASRGDWPRAIGLDNPVIAQALRDGEPVSLAQVHGWADLKPFTASAVHVACPFHSHEHKSKLVLVMRDLPFIAFSPARLRSLGRTLRVACRHLDRSSALHHLRKGRAQSRVHRAASARAFQGHVHEAFERARRESGRVFVVRVALGAPEAAGKAGLRLRRRVETYLSHEIGAGRLIAHQTKVDALSVLCPAFDRAGAEAFARELDARLARIPLPDGLTDSGQLIATRLLELDPADAQPVAGELHA